MRTCMSNLTTLVNKMGLFFQQLVVEGGWL
jgi:hypothetical protein